MLKKLLVLSGAAVMALTMVAPARAGAQDAEQKTKNAVKKTARVVTDAEITTAIRTKFIGYAPARESKIDVDTKEGVVTLTGAVPTAKARAHIVGIAKKTMGVKRVVNDMTIPKP